MNKYTIQFSQGFTKSISADNYIVQDNMTTFYMNKTSDPNGQVNVATFPTSNIQNIILQPTV